MNKLYISKKLEWLRSYFKLIAPLYPKFKGLKKISIMRSSHSKVHRACGTLSYLDEGMQISLRNYYQSIDLYPLSITLEPLSKIDILITFSHELAHICWWKHSPQHKILENQINTIFMARLKSTGYVDEETELGGLK